MIIIPIFYPPLTVCDKHIPSKVVVIRPDDKPFLNSSIRKAICKRDRIHYKAKSTNKPEHWLQYRQTRNDVISLVRLDQNTGFSTGKHEMMSLAWLE
jgi:hypothetical protein